MFVELTATIVVTSWFWSRLYELLVFVVIACHLPKRCIDESIDSSGSLKLLYESLCGKIGLVINRIYAANAKLPALDLHIVNIHGEQDAYGKPDNPAKIKAAALVETCYQVYYQSIKCE